MSGSAYVDAEIISQPDTWRRAAAIATGPTAEALPGKGDRVAVVGCGTSLYMAQAYAVLREEAGLGETDAFAASEFPFGRAYDRVVALSRSGTTTEVLELLQRLKGVTPTVAVIADPKTPVPALADATIVLDFADEKSVVQTRFATTALTLFRAHVAAQSGTAFDLEKIVADAERCVTEPLPDGILDNTQFAFLGRGWTVGLANEAGLKMTEASLTWTQSYPAMEYRHGPISIASPGTVTWMFGEAPQGLAEQVQATGGQWLAVADGRDPLAELIRVQRLAVALGGRKGLQVDNPRNLTRSVILSEV
ncbi:sugar isomerase (SIS) [Catenulispora acidiphila DSM 44928]|uniref:Sugar isomerase (SIS) n=1 Tax=Catenulispora acidiphila (strain DSM 44928 / JCM 14897 / NBRC 102108 / NRRL B-24433 / ID139908) TaxID=479433 RepID=C7QF09_CATAD|nr:sugar isomerase [Catenulispora acidiphila]ACU74767.1 sugar isomerase (SIS) [Catenulispora acidiphila DSM 44928]